MTTRAVPPVVAMTVLMLACQDSTGPAPGALRLEATGVPAGATALAVVTGPDQLIDTIPMGTALTDLAAGTYQITAQRVQVDVDLFAAAEPAVAVEVGGDHGSPQIDFRYALASGRVALTFNGIPGGFVPPAVITGPGRYVRPVTSDEIVTGIPAGTYVLTTTAIDSSGHTFAPGRESRVLVVTASPTPASAPVTYGLATARTAVPISGLPPGVDGSVTISGPEGFQTVVTATDTLIQLAPGVYTVQPNDVVVQGHTYSAPGFRVNLAPGRAAVDAPVNYQQTTGTLIVNVNGLPPNNPAPVTVESPDTTRGVAYSDTLIVTASTHTIRAPTLVTGGVEYVATDSVQSQPVAATAIEHVDVEYVFSGNATLNLSVPSAYVVQAIQRPEGSVPLIANRDGLLRVFVEASESNNMQPAVRARFFRNGTLTDSLTIPATRFSVPTTAAESPLSSSWNVLVPGSLLVGTGLAMQLEVDPDNEVPETDNTDNLFPAGGVLQPLDIRSLGAFPMRLVPIVHGQNQGDVTDANQDSYLRLLRSMFPIGADSIDVRAPFTSSAGTLQPDDQTAWSETLGEMRALRLADQFPGYYYGVVHVDYTSGIAGLGYRPSNANTDFIVSVGWDHFPSAPSVLAHELGHNFGRRHAPCGNPAGPDPSYPHPNANIGYHGIDLSSMTLKIPQQQDVMSYCNNPWVSDYTYEAIIARREASVSGAPLMARSAPTRSLLVWGRIRQDSLILEPAFEMTGRPYLPERPGPYRLRAVTQGGVTVFDVSFAGVEVADLPGAPERHFAFLLPISTTTPITSIRLTGAGRETRRSAPTGGHAPPFVPTDNITPLSAQQVRLDWDDTVHRMIMIRDRDTGDVLSFGRGGQVVVWTAAANLEVTYSNGVGGPATVRRIPGR